MIDYATQDAPIDALIWRHIADSLCPQDFRDYLQHAPASQANPPSRKQQPVGSSAQRRLDAARPRDCSAFATGTAGA